MSYEAFGSDIEKGDGNDYGTASTWTSVGCVESITPPGQSVNSVSVPTCVNAASRTQRVKPGSVSPGQCSYTMQFAPGDLQDAIDGLGDYGCWRIRLGDESNAAQAFNGFTAGYSIGDLNADGQITLTVTIQMDGDPEEVSVSDESSGA